MNLNSLFLGQKLILTMVKASETNVTWLSDKIMRRDNQR